MSDITFEEDKAAISRFYFKSGNFIDIPVFNLKWRREGNEIVSIDWDASEELMEYVNGNYEKFEILEYIDLDSIEAITTVKEINLP